MWTIENVKEEDRSWWKPSNPPMSALKRIGSQISAEPRCQTQQDSNWMDQLSVLLFSVRVLGTNFDKHRQYPRIAALATVAVSFTTILSSMGRSLVALRLVHLEPRSHHRYHRMEGDLIKYIWFFQRMRLMLRLQQFVQAGTSWETMHSSPFLPKHQNLCSCLQNCRG